MKYLLYAVLLFSSFMFVFSRSANQDEIDIVHLLKDRLNLPKTLESNKELLEKLGLHKSAWERTKELMGKSEEQYIVDSLKQKMGLPLEDKSNIILKDELLGIPNFQLPQKTWLQRLGDIFGLGRRSLKEKLYDALGGAAALELLRRSTSDIAGQTTKKVGDAVEGLKEKAYEKIGENVAGTIKQKGHAYKETLTCDTKECAARMGEKEKPSHGMLWGMLSTMTNFVFGNQTKPKEKTCEGEYYSAKECAKEKAKETVESAKDTVVCTAEMAKDRLCEMRDTVVERGAEALHAAEAATHRVGDIYESAKDKVEQIVDKSKHKASEAIKDVKDKSNRVYQEAKDTTKEAYEEAKERAKETFGEVKEKTKDVYEGAKESASEAYEDIKDRGKETIEAAKHKASNMYEGTKEGAKRVYEEAKDTAEEARESARRAQEKLKEKVGEKYEEAKEKLSQTKDNLLGKLELTRDESQIIEKLRNRLGLTADMGYSNLLEKLGYGEGYYPSSSRVNLTPEELLVVEKLNQYHTSYRKKPALEQFKENIGYNEDTTHKRTHKHEHLRDQAGLEGKPFPEDISGFGNVINEQKNVKGRYPV